jgi:Ca-activated chloride channel homolog
MNFLTPLAFLGALLAIPIILMYMLRLRRREVTISSTFLWQQVLQDREANTPWQRLRRNLLLFLQLIILVLLVLALARPFMTVPAVSAGHVTLLLDASASMASTDINGDTTRFEQAQAEALDIVDTLGSDDRLSVIRVSEVPETLISLSQDRNEARQAIRNAQPGPVEADWAGALNLAAGGGAGAEDFTIVIISDGGLPQTTGLPGINGEVRYVPVGVSNENVAITALATESLPGRSPELFAQVTNYGDTEAQVVFTLLVDGERFDSENQTIPGGSTRSITSSALPETFTTLQATLTQSVNSLAPDYLNADNVAYAVADAGGARRVLLLTEGNRFIEQALRILPGLETIITDGTTGIPPGFDLYVFDGLIPQDLPDGDIMFINPPRSAPGIFTLGAEIEMTQSVNARLAPGDERVETVDLNGFEIFRFHELGSIDWADPLILIDEGPVLVAGEVDGRQVAIMPFHLFEESNLPLLITWPVLMARLTEWFTPSVAITVTDSLNVGDSLLVRPPFEAETVRVTLPDDETRTLPVEGGTVVFAATAQPGIYTLELLDADDAVLASQLFAVNLFSPLESQIAPVAQTALTLQGTNITIEQEEALGQREFWPIIAALALAFLLLEWYAYHRQMRMPSLLRPLRRVASAG